MRTEYREQYSVKFSSPFACFLHEALMNGDGTTWGNAVDGPAAVAWVGGRHVLIIHANGFVEHVHVPAWDGWSYTDRPARSSEVNGPYVWSWIEARLPDVAAWELSSDEDGVFED